MSDTMHRQSVDTASDHSILFTTLTGVADGETIVVTFPADFDGTDLDETDVDLIEDTTPDGLCDDAGGTTKGLVADTPGTNEWTAVFSGTESRVLTFTSGGATAVIEAGSEVCIEIGQNADGTVNSSSPPGSGAAAGNTQYVNPSTTGSFSVSLSVGDGADTGTLAVPINDDDTVTINATVDVSITFDIDVGASGANCDAVGGASPCDSTIGASDNVGYVVELGSITTTDTRVSGVTDAVNLIMLDLDTNGSGGAVVTVANANGGNGLVSSSVGGDNINSTEGAVSDGTENYGLCVDSVTQTGGTMAISAPYTANGCDEDTEGNDVDDLTTAAESIVDSSGEPVSGGRVEILVQASISGITPAHNDYTDDLTFIATGTF